MTRGEAWMRLGFCAVGFALVVGVLAVHGLPEGPGLVEVLGVAVLFFGWSALTALRRLNRKREE
ncbi:MAG TPA: hypothetical protein PKD10_06780 [Paracoccaceae bacterium]|nr:hypothetical protein [Paracoccaceae bacterium]HMO72096.1 hypothetical protein [Paracoccaceae bacterium]